MTLGKVHAKIEEEKKKIGRIDGRRFNSRSREKMEREIRAIRKTSKKMSRKNSNKSSKHLVKGLFSAEEVAFEKEESLRKRAKKDNNSASQFVVCA